MKHPSECVYYMTLINKNATTRKTRHLRKRSLSSSAGIVTGGVSFCVALINKQRQVEIK